MDADELKRIRKELGTSAKDLAKVLGIEQETVLAWERGELFPTKRHVDHIHKLRERGAGAIPKRAGKSTSPLEVLADPAMWLLIRKLLAHDSLRKEVSRLAESYPEPEG